MKLIFPKETLHSRIVPTYNAKFHVQEEFFQQQAIKSYKTLDLYDKMFVLQTQINFLVSRQGERL